MLRWLEASRHKAMLALAHYDGHEKPQSSLAQYIEQTRDKQVNTVLLAAAAAGSVTDVSQVAS